MYCCSYGLQRSAVATDCKDLCTAVAMDCKDLCTAVAMDCKDLCTAVARDCEDMCTSVATDCKGQCIGHLLVKHCPLMFIVQQYSQWCRFISAANVLCVVSATVFLFVSNLIVR